MCQNLGWDQTCVQVEWHENTTVPVSSALALHDVQPSDDEM